MDSKSWTGRRMARAWNGREEGAAGGSRRLKKWLDAIANGLFLVFFLILMTLLAALSYAVTQSSRAGVTHGREEKNLVSSAALTQYPALVSASVRRMVVGGAADDQLYFNPSSDFGTEIGGDDQRRAVFHPRGGAAPYQLAPPDLIASGKQQAWIFTGRFQIEGVGTTTTGADPSGNDLIAFLPNVAASICRRINKALGIGSIMPESGLENMPDADNDAMVKGGAGFGNDAGSVIDNPALKGHSFGCFTEDSPADGPFWYYHVLVER